MYEACSLNYTLTYDQRPCNGKLEFQCNTNLYPMFIQIKQRVEEYQAITRLT